MSPAPARPHGLRSLVPDLIRTDQAANKVSDDTCFLAPHAINHDLALVALVVIPDRHVETSDCRPFILRQPRRLQRREAGLPVFRGKQSSKLIIREVDDLLQRSEVGDNFKHGVGVLCENCALGFEVCINVGATKTIDRLLRITDDKQTASPQLALYPRRSLVALPAKVPQNFCLQRIGVLEFIDENARITLR